jgi:hypothetical protein
MVKKGATLLLVLAATILMSATIASAVADVAYIYKKAFRIDNNILRTFNESNVTYDLIDERNLPVNFGQYKLIFVGDENFRYSNRILVNQFPSVVANYYHTNFWGFTDAEGVSQLGADHPLEVKKDGRMIQVYTQGRKWPGGPSVVYYFLDQENKAPGLQTVALTEPSESGESYGDVISYAYPGAQLFGGKTQQARLCFYGIIDSDYWTPAAKDLLKQCIGFVGAACEINDDCPDPEYSEGFCQGKDIYRNVTRYTCENGGLFKKCVPNQTIEFVENCPFNCQNGQCIGECERDSDCGNDTFIGEPFCIFKNVTKTFQNYTCINPSTPQSHCIVEIKNQTQQVCQDICINGACQDIECFTNQDCNDNNVSTEDLCHNPGTVQSYCTNESIACFNNHDCGTDGFSGNPFCIGKNITRLFESFRCNNPGTAASFCTSTQEQRTIQQCLDLCINGQCQGIECYQDSDCNDQNSSTLDQCINPGTVNSECRNTPINCASNNDCGFTGFLGTEFCSGQNIVKKFQNATCFNPGTLQSYCTVTQQDRILEHCDDLCVNGQCLNTACTSNADCNDFNPLTYDQCINPGTIISECRNTQINCASDIDCGTTGYLGEEYCSSDRNISKNFQTADCINPGQLYSYCNLFVNQTFINQCAYACYDGTCIRCDTNSDCNDNNAQTVDLCQNPGTLSSYCTNELINGGNVTCHQNSECGTDSPIGSPFCTGKNVSRLFQTWLCNNPGTQQSYCSTNLIVQLLQSCPNYCLNGQCVQIRCFANQDCNDGNSSTTDLCHNPGTPQSYCTNEPTQGNITCRQDSDCGADSPISPLFCSGNDVSQLVRTWDCKNPGTQQSYCASNIIIDLIQDCPEYCADGECVGIECFTNEDCDDSNPETVDICVNPGTPESYCTHNPFEIICYEDSDCGANGFVGDPFCLANNITKLFQQFECNIPGTPQSYCSTSISELTVEECETLCVDGQCTLEEGECTPGQIRSCGTNVGECRAGINVCFTNATWSLGCFGEIPPTTEICNGLDDDCDGQIDEGGVCGVGCQNECVYQSRRCQGNGYQVCGDYDPDNCTEWSQITSCSFGQVCDNGQCITPPPGCENECFPNWARECSGNGYKICGNFDQDSCLEWGSVTQCSFGETCNNGYCIMDGCENECVYQSRRCSGSGYQVCGDYDTDDCSEWSQITSCSFGETCNKGYCVPTCQDECNSGQRRCAGNGYQVCGNYDPDPCSEWSQITSCSFGQVCNNGICI